jgi:heme exporter protein A
MAAPILEATALTHLFGLTPVLHGLDFSITPGSATLIVGRNGTGKSTLIRLFAGLLAPTSGSIRVYRDLAPRLTGPTRRRLGVMTHQSLLYPNLSARENLEFYARLYSVPDPRRTAIRLRDLSRGTQQKLSFARAIIADPDLILCDEPFASLDSDAVLLAASILTDALNRGRSVVITAHDQLRLSSLEFDSWELSEGRLTRTESGPPRQLRKVQA